MGIVSLFSNYQYVKSAYSIVGAGGGTRTHKDKSPADFKSAASADSATPAEKSGGGDRIRTGE